MHTIDTSSQDASNLPRTSPQVRTYEERVQDLEDQGLTRSDAQGVVDAEILSASATGQP